MNRRIFLWGLYGLANTPLTVAIGGLYLAQWVVLDNHLDDIWYGGVFTLATILLLVTSPFWGAWSDQIGKRKPFITWMTAILLVAGTLLGLVATSTWPAMTRVVVVLLLFFVLQYFYQLSLIFYNALVSKLSTAKTVGWVSGVGDFFDELGWLVGPALLLPFASGAIVLWGEPGRAQVFIPAMLFFIVLGLPMLLWFKEPVTVVSKEKADFKTVYARTIRGLVDMMKKNRNVALFLVAFMFVSDALLTVSLYFAIFLDQVFGLVDFQKVLILATLTSVALFSALVIGKISDRVGGKWALVLSCWILFGGALGASITSSVSFLYAVSAVLGIGFAGFYVTSRSMLLAISPKSQHGEYFGFYSTFQKFASIVGPLAWGATTFLLKDYGVVKYRAAILVLALLILVGTGLMMRVKEK